jgi:hypothetical protein
MEPKTIKVSSDHFSSHEVEYIYHYSLSLSSQTTVQFIFLFCFINTNFTEDLDNHESSIWLDRYGQGGI